MSRHTAIKFQQFVGKHIMILGRADSGRDRQKENRPERSLSLRQRKKVQEVLRTVTEVWTPLPF